MADGLWVRLETIGPPVWKGDPESCYSCSLSAVCGFQGFFHLEGAFFVEQVCR